MQYFIDNITTLRRLKSPQSILSTTALSVYCLAHYGAPQQATETGLISVSAVSALGTGQAGLLTENT